MKALRWMALAVAGVGLFLEGSNAFAYPELIRYGYVNCIACHVAPTGGGTLTPYGRQASREVLSTWGYEGEEKPAYFINTPQWLNLGGDYRSAYAYQNTPRVEQGTYNFMQLDLEAAAQYKEWTLDASVGYQDPPDAQTFVDHLISRRHYLMYRVTDEIFVRGGRFFPAYGIYTPNHSLVIRDQLNIHEPEQLGDGESYNLEASYIGDPYNLIVTGIFGRPDDPNNPQRDVGVSVVASRAFLDRYRVGMSYLYGTSDLHNRNVFGPFGLLGFTSQLYLLTELDFQAYTSKTTPGYASPQWGFAETSRFGYEFVKGLQLVIDQEFSRTAFSNLSSLKQRYGAGIWWFPRPHFEFALEYQKRQDRAQPFTDFYDYAYFLWHIYL